MIYFIQQEHTGNIKIGYTERDPAQRLVALQTANAEKLLLLGTMTGTREDEKKLHSFFRAYKLHGEWYRPDKNLLGCILSFALKMPGPYNEDPLVNQINDKINLCFENVKLKPMRDQAIKQIEKEYLNYVLKTNNGIIKNTAKSAGITTRQLYKLMNKYGIKKEDFKPQIV